MSSLTDISTAMTDAARACELGMRGFISSRDGALAAAHDKATPLAERCEP